MDADLLDGLTGLPNLRSLIPRITSALASKGGSSSIVALILADLDGLKQINDNFGHSAGDEVIKRVGNLLQAITRDEAFVSRFGGDEFLVLCAGTTESRAEQLAFRIEAEVSSLLLNWEGRLLGPLSISTGVALSTQLPHCSPGGRSDDECLVAADDLLLAADIALHRSKRSGDDPPTTPTAVPTQRPRPRAPADAHARLSDNEA